MISADWFLLGAPWDCSGTSRGEQAAPDALRRAGLLDLVDADVGDADCVIGSTRRDPATGVLALQDTVRAAKALASALEAGRKQHPSRRPLVVGGDCSILLGIFLALRRQAVAASLLFVDGHPDYLDGASSDTGETADMDLAVLTGSGESTLTDLAGPQPMVDARDVVLLGHRTDVADAGAMTELARLPAELLRIDAQTVTRDPVAAGLRAAHWLAGTEKVVWVHVDVDVLDPGVMPAVTYPQPGGLDWEQLAAAIEPIAQSPRLAGVSVADFRPDLDPGGVLAKRLVTFLSDALP